MDDIKIILMVSGVAFWVLILAVVGGVIGSLIRIWDGWQKIKNWWWVTTGGK
jgi:hypothetical protein